MIKTRGGMPIYLDNDFEENGKPGISFGLNICWFFIALFVFTPMQFLAWRSGISEYPVMGLALGWWLLFGYVVFSIACVLFLRVSFFKNRHPMAYHWGQLIGLSFRIFYIGALLFLYQGGVNWWALLIVAALWLFSELTNHYEIQRVSDRDIIRTFRKRFFLHPEGYWLYNPIENIKDLHTRDREPWVAWRNRFEYFGASILILIGPILFIRSHLYRDDFEPRFLIIGGMAMAMAMAVRHMTTEVAIARRALTLKRQEA